MKPETKENLSRLILRIDAMLIGMHAGIGERPDYLTSDRQTYWNWDKRYRAGLEQVKQTLIDEEGARFRSDGGNHYLTLAGTKSSCTSGWEGLFRNWQNAARRRIAETMTDE